MSSDDKKVCPPLCTAGASFHIGLLVEGVAASCNSKLAGLGVLYLSELQGVQNFIGFGARNV